MEKEYMEKITELLRVFDLTTLKKIHVLVVSFANLKSN